MDAFVLALAASADALVYSTFLGGSEDEQGQAIALDGSGRAHVAGWTTSADFPTASATQATFGGDSDSFIATLPAPTRTISYSYDGLSRLTGAVESPGTTYAYSYDRSGNRISVIVNGTITSQPAYNAADQVVGWSYDAAGNLLDDGTTTSTYDALDRLLTTSAVGQTRTNSYNGDGVLVAQEANGTTTRYTQDLIAPLAQVLQTSAGGTTTTYLYGLERLASVSGGTRSWCGGDARPPADRAYCLMCFDDENR